MVVDFRTCEINQSTHKLVWIFTLIKKKVKDYWLSILVYSKWLLVKI
jgi:hypothetical protein